MATLTGMDRAEKAISKAFRTALTGRVKKFIMADLNQRLKSQEQPDGSAFPKKFQTEHGDKVRAEYKRNGWNTEKFLIRTGESVRLSSAYSNRGGVHELTITPIGHEILSHHVPKRVEWFPDYSEGAARDVILNIMSEEVTNELR